ncbi:MAG: DUF2784 domain-containing protein [Thermodesulfobacteriota bacterium]
MDSPFFFLLIADAILLLHVLLVAFILVGLTLIFVGNVLAWSWVRNPWFRIAHLSTIGVVVIQSWFGVICPFTTWEMALRSRAGDAVYSGTFISHWLETILYYQAPAWIFVVCYTALGAVVVASWFYVRPRSFNKSFSDSAT